jgi:MSHA pilin protein MshD
VSDRERQRGVTLIELIVSIVIVTIAVGAILGTLSTTTSGSADPMLRHQAVAIAEAYLEEIMLRPLSDPNGIDGEVLRAEFDDIDDYDGLADAGARDQFGNLLANLGEYNIAVSVAPSGALPGVPASDTLRIDVEVSWRNDIDFVLSAYRTRL